MYIYIKRHAAGITTFIIHCHTRDMHIGKKSVKRLPEGVYKLTSIATTVVISNESTTGNDKKANLEI